MVKRYFFLGISLSLAMLVSVAHGDQNGIKGEVLNFERVGLGAGPFDHGAASGDASNTIASATFTGGFDANTVLIEGDIIGVLDFNGNYWLGEADIIGTFSGVPAPGSTPASDFNWGNPLGTVPNTTGTLSYSASIALETAGDFGGDWNFEFIDTFDDGAGADSQSSNVFVEFQNKTEDQDFQGLFSLGTISEPGSASSIGEFLVAGQDVNGDEIFDQYALTLTADGFLTFETDFDPDGLGNGDAVDTEIAIFDSSGVQVAYNDDGGNGLYSLLDSVELTKGDYTLVVAGFGSNISSAGDVLLGDVTSGTSTGDYQLNITFVPEPSSAVVLLVGGILAINRRRR